MVARRHKQRPDVSAYEAVAAALAKVETVSEEEMAAFWGPDWKERERRIDEDIAAGRVERFYSDEEFLASLEALDAEERRASADVREDD
jgi:hypothetical protein